MGGVRRFGDARWSITCIGRTSKAGGEGADFVRGNTLRYGLIPTPFGLGTSGIRQGRSVVREDSAEEALSGGDEYAHTVEKSLADRL